MGGNSVTSNGSDGVVAGSGSAVYQNTSRGNTEFGLNPDADSAYRENVISGNTAGTVTGTGVDAGANAVNGVVTATPRGEHVLRVVARRQELAPDEFYLSHDAGPLYGES